MNKETKHVTPAVGEFAIQELERLRASNAVLVSALRFIQCDAALTVNYARSIARTTLDKVQS